MTKFFLRIYEVNSTYFMVNIYPEKINKSNLITSKTRMKKFEAYIIPSEQRNKEI